MRLFILLSLLIHSNQLLSHIRFSNGFATPSSIYNAKNGIESSRRQQQRLLYGTQIRSTQRRKYRATTNDDSDEDSIRQIKELVGYTDKFNQLLQESLNDPISNGKNGLRNAIQYLREAQERQTKTTNHLSRKSWNMIFNAIEERTANAEENTENLRQLQEASMSSMTFPPESIARIEMTDMYRVLKDMKELKLFGAASTTPITRTNSDQWKERLLPVGGSYNVPPTLLERILEIPMSSLTPKPSNTLLWVGALFALLEGIISITVGIPFNLLVVSTLIFVIMDRLLLNGAIAETCYKILTPGMQEKITRHEAGHFLIAYLLGCPVEGIVLSAWGALQDKRFQNRSVSAGTSFYDPELSNEMNGSQQSNNNPYQSRGLITRSSIDRYSIIVMAGIAAEADCYGRADGGAGDEMALVVFLSQLSNNYNRLKNWYDTNNRITATAINGGVETSQQQQQWNSETIRNQARWGAMQATLLLRHYKPAYDALVDALERGGALGDCVYAIEKAARDYNLRPITAPVNGYIIEDSNGVADYRIVSDIQQQQNQLQQDVLPAIEVDVHKEFDQDEAQKSLEEYRLEIQKKLQDVENQLKELQ